MMEKSEGRAASFMHAKMCLLKKRLEDEQRLEAAKAALTQPPRESARTTKGSPAERLGSTPPRASIKHEHDKEMAKKDRQIKALEQQVGTLQSKLDTKIADCTEARRVRDNHQRTLRRIKLKGGGDSETPCSPDTPIREAKLFIQYQKSKRPKDSRMFVLQATVNIKPAFSQSIVQQQQNVPPQAVVQYQPPPPQPQYPYMPPPPPPTHHQTRPPPPHQSFMSPPPPPRQYWDGRQWRTA